MNNKSMSRVKLINQQLTDLIGCITEFYRPHNIIDTIILIDGHSHVFKYAYWKTYINDDVIIPLNAIWKFHPDINFHILKTYRLPLRYVLNKLHNNIISDDQTVIILSLYLSYYYNDIIIFDGYGCDENWEYPLLNEFAKKGKHKTVQYLLDIGVTQYIDHQDDCETIYGIDLYWFKLHIETKSAEQALCDNCILFAINEHIYNNSLRSTWIKSCTI